MTEQSMSTGSGDGVIKSSLDLPTNFEFAFKIKGNTNYGLFLKPTTDQRSLDGFFDGNTIYVQANTTNSSTYVRSSINGHSTSTYYSYKFIVEGTNVRMFINDTEYTSASGCSWLSEFSSFNVGWGTWGSGTFYWKDILIKPL